MRGDHGELKGASLVEPASLIGRPEIKIQIPRVLQRDCGIFRDQRDGDTAGVVVGTRGVGGGREAALVRVVAGSREADAAGRNSSQHVENRPGR